VKFLTFFLEKLKTLKIRCAHFAREFVSFHIGLHRDYSTKKKFNVTTDDLQLTEFLAERLDEVWCEADIAQQHI
jgi:hypothetical protein